MNTNLTDTIWEKYTTAPFGHVGDKLYTDVALDDMLDIEFLKARDVSRKKIVLSAIITISYNNLNMLCYLFAKFSLTLFLPFSIQKLNFWSVDTGCFMI
jgi:hypothetical protein